MPKKRAVPAALRAELSEYTYLLRTLKVEAVQDLAKHVVPRKLKKRERTVEVKGKGRAESGTEVEPDFGVEEDEGEGDEGSEFAPDEESESEDVTETDDEDGPVNAGARARDIRWPLMEEDVYVPEWTLGDEVSVIANQVLAQQGAQSGSPDSDASDSSDVDALPEAYTDTLTASTSMLLAQILSLLVAHWPEAAKSMQNRVRPMGWIEVLDIVSASGAVGSEVLERVRQRMGASGDEGALAVQRRKIVEDSQRTLREVEKLYEEDLFEVPELPPLKHGRPGRPRKRRKTPPRTWLDVAQVSR